MILKPYTLLQAEKAFAKAIKDGNFRLADEIGARIFKRASAGDPQYNLRWVD